MPMPRWAEGRPGSSLRAVWKAERAGVVSKERRALSPRAGAASGAAGVAGGFFLGLGERWGLGIHFRLCEGLLGFGAGRIELQGGAKLGQGGVALVLPQEQRAEVRLGLRPRRIELRGAAKGGLRLLRARAVRVPRR